MKQIYESLLLEAMEERGEGVCTEEKHFAGGSIRRVQLEQKNPYGRPAGNYVTVELQPVQGLQEEELGQAVAAVAGELRPMLRGKRVLVAALGNRDITPDSLGPKMTRHLMITRPLEMLQPEVFRESGLRSVAAVCTNVFGTTGVESAEMIAGITGRIGAQTVIVIDALATEHRSRLCTTVQLSDGGLAPGAGVGNHRALLNAEVLGVPVISVGMPTVMSARKLTEKAEGEELLVMPTDIGVATDNGAKLLAFALNQALHDVSIREMLGYLS